MRSNLVPPSTLSDAVTTVLSALSYPYPELVEQVSPCDVINLHWIGGFLDWSSFFRKAGSGDYEVPHGEDLWKLFLVMALNKVRAKGAFHRAAKRDIRGYLPPVAGSTRSEMQVSSSAEH